MTTPPDEPEGPRSSPPFTFDEVADLREGRLSAEEEENLRMRLRQDPERARTMLCAINTVETVFPDPPNLDDPLRVPPRVDAKWQEAIARAAARRAAPDAPGEDCPGEASGDRDTEPDNHDDGDHDDGTPPA